MDLSEHALDPAESALIRRILKSKRCGSARVAWDDLPAGYAADRLVARGWVEAWDTGDLRGLRATLTVGGANALKHALVGSPARWRPVGAPPPHHERAKSGKVVYATDMGPGFKLAENAVCYDKPPDDGKYRRPTVLIGGSTVWCGPEPMRAVCRCCGNSIASPSHVCLKCSRGFGDGPAYRDPELVGAEATAKKAARKERKAG